MEAVACAEFYQSENFDTPEKGVKGCYTDFYRGGILSSGGLIIGGYGSYSEGVKANIQFKNLRLLLWLGGKIKSPTNKTLIENIV